MNFINCIEQNEQKQSSKRTKHFVYKNIVQDIIQIIVSILLILGARTKMIQKKPCRIRRNMVCCLWLNSSIPADNRWRFFAMKTWKRILTLLVCSVLALTGWTIGAAAEESLGPLVVEDGMLQPIFNYTDPTSTEYSNEGSDILLFLCFDHLKQLVGWRVAQLGIMLKDNQLPHRHFPSGGRVIIFSILLKQLAIRYRFDC